MSSASPVKRILVLGGTGFIGRAFCELLIERTRNEVALLNRAQTNRDCFPQLKTLVCDRDNAEACEAALKNSMWDSIVDFTGTSHDRIQNVIQNCSTNHYCFISSSAVDLSWPEDALFSMAQNKLWCENQLANFCDRLLIVRPGFVVGKYDYTQRFERKNAIWVWKGTDDPVQPMITVDFLASLLMTLVEVEHTGIVRAGYTLRPKKFSQAS